MKFSEQWLRQWVNPPVTTEGLADQLTAAGLEVDSVVPVAGSLERIVIGEVRSVVPHPTASRLTLCEVDIGEPASLVIVCGASNVREKMRAPVALVGARLADGTRIEKTRIRGQESAGMLCSAQELGLAETSEGLLELPADAPLGRDLVAYLGLRDVTITVELTPNRSDCLCLAGIAREVGVLNRFPVARPAIPPIPPTITDTFPVTIEAPQDCPRYVGRVLKNVALHTPSPLWLQERLRRSGLRSIHPVVDITNYVMLELGQPMHAFDLEKLAGGIRVRRGQAGESLKLLDGNVVPIEPGTLVIADQSGPLALAGIMGGKETAVTDSTCHLFLESAFFTPLTLAGQARRYSLDTDSARRFERGVDPNLQGQAMERATALLLEIVGGEPGPLEERVSTFHLPAPKPVLLRQARIGQLLGLEVPPTTVSEILERLGMEVVAEPHGWRVTPPSFRFDLGLEADLIEEVARVVGFEQIPQQRPRLPLTMLPQAEAHVPLRRIRQVLIERGYQEAITYSFVDPDLQTLLEPGVAAKRLVNPISAEMAAMRTSLWPGLVQALLHNTRRQQGRVRLFEAGLVFRLQEEELQQTKVLGGIAAGLAYPEQWGIASRDIDFFDVKSDVSALLGLTGRAEEYRFSRMVHPALHPGQSAAIERHGRRVGWIGMCHPRIARELKLALPAVVFELAVAELQQGTLPVFQKLSKYPMIRRDVAIVVDDPVSLEAIYRCIGQIGVDVLKNIELFDVYRGQGIPSGKKSLALGLTFQSSSRTLNDEEADELVTRVVDALGRDLQVMLRS